jgi:hypothetical protein
VPQARLVLDRLAQERRKNSVAACFGAPAAALHRRLEVAPPPSHTGLSPCLLGLSATSQQYFSLRTKQSQVISQHYFSLKTN